MVVLVVGVGFLVVIVGVGVGVAGSVGLFAGLRAGFIFGGGVVGGKVALKSPGIDC